MFEKYTNMSDCQGLGTARAVNMGVNKKHRVQVREFLYLCLSTKRFKATLMFLGDLARPEGILASLRVGLVLLLLLLP